MGGSWIVAVVAAVWLLLGLAAAFGAFDRRGHAPGRSRTTPVSHTLADAVERQLADLDPIEHRRLALGRPWPAVVVGPTGIAVVAVADRPGAAVVEHARRVRSVARQVAATTPGPRRISVTAVVVLPDRQVTAWPLGDVTAVTVGDLGDLLARGPLVPLATVDALTARLRGQLDPETLTAVG